jgi:hypothetical protein
MTEIESKRRDAAKRIKDAEAAAIGEINNAKNGAIESLKTLKDLRSRKTREAERLALKRIRSALMCGVCVCSIMLILALVLFCNYPDIMASTSPTNWKQVVVMVVPQCILGAICVVLLITQRGDDA